MEDQQKREGYFPPDINAALDYIIQHKAELGTWRDCARLYREKTGETISSDALRMRSYTRAEQLGYETDDAFYRFEKEKIQYRDERNARNAEIRREARLDQKFDYLSKQISEIQKIQFPIQKKSQKIKKSKKSIAVLFSDWHLGLCYDDIFGRYNSDIAKDRIGQILRRIKSIQKNSEADEIHIILLGDLISGNIHKSIQVTNRENVIEQIKQGMELLVNIIYELIPHFRKIIVTSCPGNHTRMDRKDDALNDERLDNLIVYFAQRMFENERRVQFTKPVDPTISTVDIRGKTYFVVHGDYDAYTQAAADRLANVMGTKPEGIFYGHMHTPAYDTKSEITLIRGGCLCGSGDEYTTRKRLKGKPCQVILICTEDGVQDFIPVYLD